jgi:hypothetical protein
VQAQYNVHSSEYSVDSASRSEPLRYGLNPTRYRVRHFGHSTQWRRRGVMAGRQGLANLVGEGRTFSPSRVVAGESDEGRWCSCQHIELECF